MLLILMFFIILPLITNNMFTNELFATPYALLSSSSSEDLSIYPNSNISCLWYTQYVCRIFCNEEYKFNSDLTAILNSLWQEKPNCHSHGINLDLRQTEISQIIPAKWFNNIPVKILEITVEANSITHIENDGFGTESFRTTERLVLVQPSFDILWKGALKGLTSLRELHIKLSAIKKFEHGVLDPVVGTIQSLYFVSKINDSILVDGLTGGGKSAKHLRTVIITANLSNTLTSKSFLALTNVVEFDLSGCGIESIGENTFQPISKTIATLKLFNNKLKHFPVGLFDGMFYKDGLQVTVDQTGWHCLCDLCYTRWLLRNGFNFVPSNLICEKPLSLADHTIRSEMICFKYDCDEYSLTDTTQNSQYFEKTCSSPSSSIDMIDIDRSDGILKIRELGTTDKVISVDFLPLADNFLLLWYNNDILENYSGINCSPYRPYSKEYGHSVNISNLTSNSAYVFCSIEKTKKHLSPLNCKSFYVIGNVDLRIVRYWIGKEHQTMVTALIACSFILSLAIGFGVGYYLLWIHPHWLCGGRNILVVKSSKRNLIHNFQTKPMKHFDIPRERIYSLMTESTSSSSSLGSANYEIALNPSQFEIIKQRLERLDQLERQQIYQSLNYYQYADIGPKLMAPNPPSPPIHSTKIQLPDYFIPTCIYGSNSTYAFKVYPTCRHLIGNSESIDYYESIYQRIN